MSTRPIALRAPRTTAQATELLARYAEADAQLAQVEADRKEQIGRFNADADVYATPLLAERAAVVAALQPWWAGAAAGLTDGKRKSVQLGGCMIGTRMARPSLAHGFASDADAVTALRASSYAKATTSVRYAIDRPATLKLIVGGGKPSKALGEMAFRSAQAETFFVERVEQGGVVSSG